MTGTDGLVEVTVKYMVTGTSPTFRRLYRALRQSDGIDRNSANLMMVGMALLMAEQSPGSVTVTRLILPDRGGAT